MIRPVALATLLAVLAAPVPVLAANARHPYSNVDRRVDAGNDTGDSQVDALNQQQLNRGGAPGRGRPGTLAYPYPPPAYYPPPVAYAPPAVVAPYPYYGYARPYRYYYPY